MNIDVQKLLKEKVNFEKMHTYLKLHINSPNSKYHLDTFGMFPHELFRADLVILTADYKDKKKIFQESVKRKPAHLIAYSSEYTNMIEVARIYLSKMKEIFMRHGYPVPDFELDDIIKIK